MRIWSEWSLENNLVGSRGGTRPVPHSWQRHWRLMILNDLEWLIPGHVNYSKAIISQLMFQIVTMSAFYRKLWCWTWTCDIRFYAGNGKIGISAHAQWNVSDTGRNIAVPLYWNCVHQAHNANSNEIFYSFVRKKDNAQHRPVSLLQQGYLFYVFNTLIFLNILNVFLWICGWISNN